MSENYPMPSLSSVMFLRVLRLLAYELFRRFSEYVFRSAGIACTGEACTREEV